MTKTQPSTWPNDFTPWALAWWEPEARKTLAKNLLIVLCLGAFFTLFQGGILSSVAQRALRGFEGDAETLAEQNVSLQVSLDFPKEKFLQHLNFYLITYMQFFQLPQLLPNEDKCIETKYMFLNQYYASIQI